MVEYIGRSASKDLLTRGEVRALSANLRDRGMKLPKSGWCKTLPADFSYREVCAYGRGAYMLVGWRGGTKPTVRQPKSTLGRTRKK